MSLFAFLGAIEIGLVYGLVALGVYITFRVLDFPDLTVDGSFPMGAAVSAAAIVAGVNPWLATGMAIIAGGMTGLVTGFLAIRCGILHLLAGILTMIAAFSINIRIMGRPNISLLKEPTVLDAIAGFTEISVYARPIFVALIAFVCAGLLVRFLHSDFGLAMRATGVNGRMVRANGGNTAMLTYAGLAISNALAALGGSLFAQTNGFADVTAGVGTIVVGLAAVILGETLFRSTRLVVVVFACIAGSILYRLAIAFALSTGAFGLQASDLNLVTALLVASALVMPKIRAARQAAKAAKS
ncbi:MAG: ABC transporter permease [Alphaproteobacteria bacterium]